MISPDPAPDVAARPPGAGECGGDRFRLRATVKARGAERWRCDEEEGASVARLVGT
jgi:hypothetical protein